MFELVAKSPTLGKLLGIDEEAIKRIQQELGLSQPPAGSPPEGNGVTVAQQPSLTSQNLLQ